MNNVLSIVLNELTNDNRVLNQAHSLSNHGYNVTLLAVKKSKSSLPLTEKIKNLQIIRIFTGYGSKGIYKVRYVRYIYRFFMHYQFFPIVLDKRFDAIHCHDLSTLQYGFVAKLFRGKSVKLIFDAHEYETEKNSLYGLRKIRLKIKEKLLINSCDRVITVSNSIAKEYSKLYDIQKPTVILNCPIIDPKSEIVKHDIFREKFNIPISTKIFLYQGYLYVGRGIEITLKAFNELKQADLALVFMGEGPELKKIKSDKLFGSSVFVHPFVSSKEIIKHTSSADYGISFIEDISLSDRYCLPNKLFEYIAAGLPVITSGLPEMEVFVKEYGVGVSSRENSVSGFMEAFKKLLTLDQETLDQNIKKTRKKFNWSTQEKILLNVYKDLNIESINNLN